MSTPSTPQISILGCGWLGLPLAQSLITRGLRVKGSTTSSEKIPLLEEHGILPYRIRLKDKAVEGPIADFVRGSDILIVDVPPGLRGDPSADFTSRIGHLLKAIAASEIRHILFISSTSVFPESDNIFEEDERPHPATEAGKQLFMAEQLVTTDERLNTVLRFGGLIGPGRHPVHFLSGRTGLRGGNHYINLIHLDDCIGLILAIITGKHWGRTLHGVAPYHPVKSAYYTAIAGKMKIAPPQYEHPNDPPAGKLISSEKTSLLLSYKFIRRELDALN